VQLVRNLGRNHRIVYLVVGIALIAYAIAMYGLLPNLAIAALLVFGALFVISAGNGH
jgi:hypothetical protein